MTSPGKDSCDELLNAFGGATRQKADRKKKQKNDRRLLAEVKPLADVAAAGVVELVGGVGVE